MIGLQAIRDNRSSLRDIAEMIQDSPALALSVIRETNGQAHGRLTTPAENLEVALNRLGVKRTEALLGDCPPSRCHRSPSPCVSCS